MDIDFTLLGKDVNEIKMAIPFYEILCICKMLFAEIIIIRIS